MELLRILTVLIVALQCSLVYCNLPQLPLNELLTGDDKEIPGATLIDCVRGRNMILSDFQTWKTFNPSGALRPETFERYPFTSHGVIPGALVHGGIGKFSFVNLREGVLSSKRVYALQATAYGEYAYWLPQGGYVDVPQYPSENQPHYVFTPDFSGCSWTVTPMSNGMLRLRHVEGGHEVDQFNNLSFWQIGGTLSYAMQFRDYGYVQKNGRVIKHITGWAYMKYSDCRWTLHVQHQTCAPRPGNTAYLDMEISTMKMIYFPQNSWAPVTATDFWEVPAGPVFRLQRRSREARYFNHC